VTYRDSFEACPRCGVDLVAARDARACPQCGGLWIDEMVVSEMVLEMLPPQPISRLELRVLDRAGEPIACPTCKGPMHTATIHGVGLDRCGKHGVWFEAGELQRALERVADPRLPPPLVPLAPARRSRSKTATVELEISVEAPGQPIQQLRLIEEVIKIGSFSSAHVRLVDPKANRMHAIIDAAAADAVWLIDLGSSSGTFVNGLRIAKARLSNGDRITIGRSTLTVTIKHP
jgi:Zn-finger nucleic acid-binding protein